MDPLCQARTKDLKNKGSITSLFWRLDFGPTGFTLRPACNSFSVPRFRLSDANNEIKNYSSKLSRRNEARVSVNGRSSPKFGAQAEPELSSRAQIKLEAFQPDSSPVFVTELY